MTGIAMERHGRSRAFDQDMAPFPPPSDGESADVLILAGDQAGSALQGVDSARYRAVLVELGSECLGAWTGESRGQEGGNVLGFNRFRLGEEPASQLVELVKQPGTSQDAIEAARAALESAGFQTAVCNDRSGRIVDRMVRPYFNAALTALDEGLATADDLDLTVRLGLGYPEGPITLLERSGLAAHAEVSQALYEAYGEPGLLPARRARVARARQEDAS